EEAEKKNKKKKKDEEDGEYAEGLDNLLGCAAKFMSKTGKGINRKKKENCLNAPYKRGKSVIGNSIFTNVLGCEEDLALLERTYSAAELVLLASPEYPLEMMHRKAVAAIGNARLANEKVGVEEGMTINQCLAWLARAGRCSVASLIPPGEYYPDAEDYLTVRLLIPALPLFSTVCASYASLSSVQRSSCSKRFLSEQDWTIYQLTRCMQMMAVANLANLLPDDRCILTFALGMLYIDDAASEEMRGAAHSVVENAMSSCPDHSLLLEPLFNLTPLIVRRPDEAFKWILLFKGCGVAPPELILAIGASYFVYVCERAECTPDAFHYASPSATITAYVDVISETMIDVFAVYNPMPHRRFHNSLISLLNICLSPSVLQGCEEKSKKALLMCIQAVRNRLNPDLADDSIVITELRTLARRVEMVRSGRGGRRNSEEVSRIYVEREKNKEEMREELREAQREKELLKRQREEKQRSAASTQMKKDEKEEEEDEMSSEGREGSEERREMERMEEEDDEEEEEEEDDREEKSSSGELESTDGEMSERGMQSMENKQVHGAPFSNGNFMEVEDDEASKDKDSDIPDTVPDTMDEMDSQNWLTGR
ncbi:hypothetical protein PMAYCL1PPCAC_12864, partial [Pristionchus mayeri]